MRCRDLVLASGAALAITMTPAMAQYDRGSDQKERQADAQRAIESVLDDLEGTWRVEVDVNPRFWSMIEGAGHENTRSGHGMMDQGMMDRKGKDRDTASRDRKDASGDRDRSATASMPDGVTLRGVAQTKLILGDHVLRERFRVTGEDESAERSGGDARRSESMEDEGLRVLTLFSFDEDTGRYSMVAMNDRSGAMHYDTGTYDAESKEIVFDGRIKGYEGDRDAGMRPMHDRNAGSGDAKDQKARSAGGHAMGASPRSGMEGVRVVLEITGPDTHRVTMYDAGRATGSQENADRRSGNRDRTTDRDRRADASSATSPHGEILYQATYHRASGLDELTWADDG